MSVESEEKVGNGEDQLAYVQQLQDQCHKLRTQLSLGFSGEGEKNVLLVMLVRPIREPILSELERIEREYKKILNEEAGKILMKCGSRIVQDGKPRQSILEMFEQISRENKLAKDGIFIEEQLTPNMFTWNYASRREYDISILKSQNYINGKILQLVLDRLFECGLLLEAGSRIETPNAKIYNEIGSEQL